ncbi:MAG: NHL repeat-containing protein [Candidatus Peribacteraceae bacterium]|jgi:sugar lactone lactonase YvrE|nr:NHL repeat-containing protein [Candidatus Peribacteraceae bacterium]
MTALVAFIALSMRQHLFLRTADIPSSHSPSFTMSSSSDTAVPASPWPVRQVSTARGIVRFVEGFAGPYGLTVFQDGTLYVMDALRGQVVRFSASLQPLGILDPKADSAEFLHSIARIADGTLLLSEHRKGWIRRYADDGTVLGYFFADPPDPTLAFVGPVNVFVDAAQNIWVTDYRAHRVFKFNPQGAFIGWIGAKAGGGVTNGFAVTGMAQESAAPGGFNQPHMTTVNRAGDIFVVDVANHRVQKFSAQGKFIGWIGACADGTVTQGWTQEGTSALSEAPGGFQRPTSVTLAEGSSRAEDVLIVADTSNNRIQKFRASDGRLLGWMGEKTDGTVTDGWEMTGRAQPGSKPGAFIDPFGAQIWNGFLYVADRGNTRIQIIPD